MWTAYADGNERISYRRNLSQQTARSTGLSFVVPFGYYELACTVRCAFESYPPWTPSLCFFSTDDGTWNLSLPTLKLKD